MRRIYAGLIALISLMVMTPFFFAASCVLNKADNVIGWNITFLEKQLTDKQTFVFYYGTDRCFSCQTAKKALKESSAWQEAVKAFKKAQQQKFAVYWYSEYIYRPQGQKRRDFDQKLIQLFEKQQIKNGKALVKSGVPLIIFFKDGQNVNELNAWKGPNKIADLVQGLKDLT